MYMNYYEVSPAKASGNNISSLTYQSDEIISLGTIVEINIRGNVLAGVVIKKVGKPKFACKPIEKILNLPVLPQELLTLSVWISQFYTTPLPTIWQGILPRGVLKKRRGDAAKLKTTKSIKLPPLNTAQKKVVSSFEKSTATTHLLQGVTGSGKTRVYIELAKKQLNAGNSVMILVPEIALTPQLLETFTKAIDTQEVLVTHSNITESQRHKLWQKIIESNEPLIVIGPRSALFMPLQNLGLIVMDEAHESSYKQESSPRYNTAHVAAKLASLHSAKLLLGSATPNVVDRYITEAKGGEVLRLDKQALQQEKNKTTVVDMKDKSNFGTSRILSKELSSSLEKTLIAKRQSILLINRRGSSTSITCNDCGWTAVCPTCQMPLTFHRDTSNNRCHTCGHTSKLHTSCPECGQTDLKYLGYGTKQVETEVKKLWPDARVARLDRDSMKKDYHEQLYQQLKDGEIDILIGTQMVAKGLDLPLVDTIGVVMADSMLFIPDFVAGERTFQLLRQVAGRTGRHDKPGHIVVQTYSPDHPIIKTAIRGDYDDFYTNEIEERKLLGYPPFRFLLKIECRYATAEKATNELRAFVKTNRLPGVSLLGPAPSWREHVGNKYQWQIILRSAKRSDLVKIATKTPGNWTVDLDPQSLL